MESFEDLGGVRAGILNLNNIRYAADTILIADSEEKLQELVGTLHGACALRGLHTNLGRGKIEVMDLTKRIQELILNTSLEGGWISHKRRQMRRGCTEANWDDKD